MLQPDPEPAEIIRFQQTLDQILREGVLFALWM